MVTSNIHMYLNTWLVVWTHLKNISRIGHLPQIGVNIKNIWNHQLVLNTHWLKTSLFTTTKCHGFQSLLLISPSCYDFYNRRWGRKALRLRPVVLGSEGNCRYVSSFWIDSLLQMCSECLICCFKNNPHTVIVVPLTGFFGGSKAHLLHNSKKQTSKTNIKHYPNTHPENDQSYLQMLQPSNGRKNIFQPNLPIMGT